MAPLGRAADTITGMVERTLQSSLNIS
jgi:hypothetical protein